MNFIFRSVRTRVSKARRRTVDDLAQALAQKLEPRAARAFFKAFVQLKDLLAGPALEDALARGEGLEELRRAVPGALRPLVDTIKDSVMQSVSGRYADLRSMGMGPIQFNLLNDEAAAWAATRSARLIADITAEQETNVRRLIGEAFTEGRHPYETARLIRSEIGLDDRYSRAVENYRRGLLESGMAPDLAEGRADRYATRLLNHRARVIARTETLMASNQGDRLTWQRAQKEGRLPAGYTMRRWIRSSEGACKLCAPMAGKLAPIDGQWTLPNGRQVSVPTESHPQCRCTSGLVFDLPEGVDPFDESQWE